MCNSLMGFGNEGKSFRRRGGPILQRLHCRTRAIRVVHFHAVELRRIVLEKFAGWRLSRIEIRLPRGVSPARGSNVDFVHEKTWLVFGMLHGAGKQTSSLDSLLLSFDGRPCTFLLLAHFGFRLCCRLYATTARRLGSTAA